jgi:SAM-dependent methyltransferase
VDKTFEDIYRYGVWGIDEYGRGVSGYGSEYMFNVNYILFLKTFIQENNCKNVVDVGCGDWSFSSFLFEDMTNVNYVGYDCVSDIILNHKYTYREKRHLYFEHVNGYNLIKNFASSPSLPYTIDLVLIKDVLQHWPTRDIVTFLTKLCNMNSIQYILITNDSTDDKNVNIKMGEYRPLNWNAPPLNRFKVYLMYEYKDANRKETYLLDKKKIDYSFFWN